MIFQSSAKDVEKLLWSLAVLILPLIGLIVWFFAGPGRKPF
ncbi:MAG: PLDc N-terminal domain-containing protein [Chromatiaceae bacterium]